MKKNSIALGMFAGLCTLTSGTPAGAATYSDTFNIDPASLTCFYYGTTANCGGYQFFNGSDPANPTPRYLTAGDDITETVQFTKPVSVPGSSDVSVFYVAMSNVNLPFGSDGLPGPDRATSTSTLQNYSGPPGMSGGPYTLSYLNEYIGGAGFNVSLRTVAPPSGGFSATGITTHFSLETTDPLPSYVVGYGYYWALPAPPRDLGNLQGGSIQNPLALPEGVVGVVSGSIGGESPANNFYQFDWDAGDGNALFQASVKLTDADQGDIFDFELLKAGDDTPIEDLVLNDANAFTQEMSVELASGTYVIGLKTEALVDPEFTITFNTPVNGASSVDAPEPSSLALLAGALLALSPFVPRRKRRHTLDTAAA